MPGTLHAFVDEAGQRSRSLKSSDHFIMSAVVIADEHLSDAAATLASLRIDLGRNPATVLHWRNIKSHSSKLHIAQSLGRAPWITICSVVVCKRQLPPSAMNDDQSYLYTLRFLLERLSWLARDKGRVATYTLAHVVRFKLEKLRAYEAVLRAAPDCQVDWRFLDPHGGRLDQPHNVEMLQLADAAASATFAAFERDPYSNVETRYLQEMSPRLYRRPPTAVTSHGLKLHPLTETTKAAHPWVAAL